MDKIPKSAFCSKIFSYHPAGHLSKNSGMVARESGSPPFKEIQNWPDALALITYVQLLALLSNQLWANINNQEAHDTKLIIEFHRKYDSMTARQASGPVF
jgi:hypothetical protein